MTHPFRFGVSCTTAAGPDEFVSAARRAEELGYSSVAIADHLDSQCGPLVALAAAASATTTIRLTPLVLANDYRHPVVLAKELATLDRFSGGRLEWGIGAGWMTADYARAGIPLDRAGVRIARLRESIAVMKGCFAGEPFSFAGEHYTIDGLEPGPPPHSRPHPPLIVAGGGPKVLTLAAEEADIVGVNFGLQAGTFDPSAGPTGSPEATDDKLAVVRDVAGTRFDDLEIQTRVHMAIVTDDRRGLADSMAGGFGLTADEALAMPHVLIGTIDEMAVSLREWRERWDISYVTWSLDAMETLAPLVERLTGS